MRFGKTLSNFIILAVLAATFVGIPVFGDGTSALVPVEELYVDSYDAFYTLWDEYGTAPYLDAVGDGNYIASNHYCSIIGYFSFEDTSLEAGEYEALTIEAYARSEDPEVEIDCYIFTSELAWYWPGPIKAGAEWSWTAVSEPDIPLLDPVEINSMTIVIHYWTPDHTSGYVVTIDAVRLILSARVQARHTLQAWWSPRDYTLDNPVPNPWTATLFGPAHTPIWAGDIDPTTILLEGRFSPLGPPNEPYLEFRGFALVVSFDGYDVLTAILLKAGFLHSGAANVVELEITGQTYEGTPFRSSSRIIMYVP